jgi:hypothetical protein
MYLGKQQLDHSFVVESMKHARPLR